MRDVVASPGWRRLRLLTASEIQGLYRHGATLLAETGVLLTWPLDDRAVLAHRMEALAAHPESWPFLIHIALDSDDAFVARIGYHTAPTTDGSVEIGYYVTSSRRGSGVAGELLDWFIGWLSRHDVHEIVATVRPDNEASLHLLQV